MKKLFLMLSVAMLTFGSANVFAQENTEAAAPATEEVAAPAGMLLLRRPLLLRRLLRLSTLRLRFRVRLCTTF